MSAATPAGEPARPAKRHQRSQPGSGKHRWTAAERAAKGRRPRRRGGSDADAPEQGQVRRAAKTPWTDSRGDSDRPANDRRRPARAERRAGERRGGDRGDTSRRFGDRGDTGRRFGDRRAAADRDRFVDRQPSGDRRRDEPSSAGAQPVGTQPVSAQPVSAQPVSAQPVSAQPVVTASVVEGGFDALGVAPELVERLTANGISTPFPIQAASIPDAVAGRDVLGRGRTGSGKTLGFGLPMLTRLARSGAGRKQAAPRGLILLPTRELATQVSDVLTPLARTVGLRTLLVAGGMSYGPQLKGLDNGIDVVIGTPGRLIDLWERGALRLDEVTITVLDEADHMADLGFLPDVTTLLDAVPADGQRMLFSATLDRGVDRVVATYLHDPRTHQVDTDQASVDTMTHYLLQVAPADKRIVTAEIANRHGRTVIFCRTQLGADRIAQQLRESGVMAGPLHGGLPQGARNRTLEAFRRGSLPVLVATDVAARGIHVDEVGLVLQVDPPADAKTYLHRAGRTARAGETGAVVTLVLPDQKRMVRRLTEDAGVRATRLSGGPGDAGLAEATGAVPTSGSPIDDREFAAVIAPPRASRKPRRGGDRPGGGPRGGHRSGGRRTGRDSDGGSRRDGDRNGAKGSRRAAYHSGR